MEVLTRWIDPTIKDLQEENKNLKEQLNKKEFLLLGQGKELKELYKKIDKAIKYIKDDNNFIDYKDYDRKEENDLLELLKILKGDDHE